MEADRVELCVRLGDHVLSFLDGRQVIDLIRHATVDDAAGEAYDKVAKLMALGVGTALARKRLG